MQPIRLNNQSASLADRRGKKQQQQNCIFYSFFLDSLAGFPLQTSKHSYSHKVEPISSLQLDGQIPLACWNAGKQKASPITVQVLPSRSKCFTVAPEQMTTWGESSGFSERYKFKKKNSAKTTSLIQNVLMFRLNQHVLQVGALNDRAGRLPTPEG